VFIIKKIQGFSRNLHKEITKTHWRTYDQKEIDMVEEREGKLYGYEFKFTSRSKKPPKLWKDTYEQAEYRVIDKENFLDLLCNK